MTEKRAALIIASYQYEDPDLRQLVAPAQDAEALARVLADPAIGGFVVQTLLNEPSYKVNRAIETFFADRKRNDLLLLYFSGHGIKDEEGRLYLTTHDTRRKLLRATAVQAAFVNDVMRYSRSRRQVLLLDCCYGGAFARGMVVRADQGIGAGEYFKEARGQVVLTASDALQYSFEGDEIMGKGVRSIFTHTLVHGLETGEADLDGDGNISVDELYDYVYERVTDEVPQQKPRKWDFDVQGEIIIARNPHPVVKPAELPSELQQSIEDLRPWVREGAVRQLGRLLQSGDKGVARAAHTALTRMVDDDSQLVRSVVAKILEAHADAQRIEKAEPPAEQLAAEQAERVAAEKPKAEPVDPWQWLRTLRKWLSGIEMKRMRQLLTRPIAVGALAVFVVLLALGLAVGVIFRPLTDVLDRRLAFVSNRDGNYEIYVMDEKGRLERLTNHVASDKDPFWSPGKARITFATNRDGNWEIYWMQDDGKELTRVTNNFSSDIEPAWSHDGSYIAFTSDRDGKREIYVAGPDGIRRITSTPGRAESWEPAWGPNATIFFTSDRGGKREIYYSDTVGKVTRLTNTPGEDESWSPAWCGNNTAFVSNRDGRQEIYVLGQEGEIQRITHTSSRLGSWEPTCSTLGGPILFTSDRSGKSEIYTVIEEGPLQLTQTPNHGKSWSPAW